MRSVLAVVAVLLSLGAAPAGAEESSGSGASAKAAPPLIVRTLRLDTVETTARPTEELTAALIAAEPRFRPCAEFLPDGPLEPAPAVRMRIVLWEGGEVRSLRLLSEEVEPMRRSTRCLTDAVQALRFPPDPSLSDDRRIEVSFQSRWTRPDLGIFDVPDEVKAALDVPDPEVRGRVDLVSIKARIDSIVPRLSRCIRAARKRTPDLGQRITVLLRLSQDREDPLRSEAWVDALRVTDSDLGDTEAEVCIIRELERLSWPRPMSQTAEVTWPFLFEE